MTGRGIVLVAAVVFLMVGMTEAMNIRAQAADVGGTAPPVAPTYLLFLWMAAVGASPAFLRRRLRLTRADVLLAYCAAMISGAVAHQYAIGFLVPHMVAPYYFQADEPWLRWLPGWFGPGTSRAVSAFFLGAAGRLPWGEWLVPGIAWTVLLAALFLLGHCAMILVRHPWIDTERLTFPLAQIPLGLSSTDAEGRPPILRTSTFWIGLAIALGLVSLRGLHRYFPQVPEVPLRPLFQIDFALLRTPPWTGMGTLEFHLSPWLVAIVALLPVEISFSAWFFFWVTKLEDVSAIAFGATDVPNVYSNVYPALYAQGAGAAYALAAVALWSSRRHLARVARAAWRNEPGAAEFAPPRMALLGFFGGLAVVIGWLWLAGMRPWVAALLVLFILGYFVLFARIRGEAGLSMGVILWPKMVDEVMLTFFGSRGLLPSELVVLYSVRWLYFGPSIGGVMACQLESFKIMGESGRRSRATGGLLLLAALLAVPVAFVWTLHTYHVKGFQAMPIGHRQLSMVGSQIYWSYANLTEAMKNPTGTDHAGLLAMGVGAVIAVVLATLRARFLWWPFHPIGYMAANSWGMHLNWLSFTLGWAIKVILLRYGGLHAFRLAIPLFIGLVVGDMLGEGVWGAFATWVALAPG